MVLLGLRSALRSDTNYSIVQMIYGQTIRLPGEFFEKAKNILDSDTFVEELQKQIDQLQPLKTRRQPLVRKPLEPPYDGPFPVTKRYDKYFTVTIKGKCINISVDRLKPAYLLLTDEDNPDHLKQFERAPTLPDKKLCKQFLSCVCITTMLLGKECGG
ncbi:retrovirus-related Pol polyprotein from transposon 412 [Trichonephila clavipes]|nr:retrovirus-related Pol polyprotein from transposon 412 [Trichonephila clavipes]